MFFDEFLAVAPKFVLVRLVANLDYYSIRPLLIAFKSLRVHAAYIRCVKHDAEHEPSLHDHLQVPDVPSFKLADVVKDSGEKLRSERRFIRLFEIVYDQTKIPDVSFVYDTLLTDSSFVLLRGPVHLCLQHIPSSGSHDKTFFEWNWKCCNNYPSKKDVARLSSETKSMEAAQHLKTLDDQVFDNKHTPCSWTDYVLDRRWIKIVQPLWAMALPVNPMLKIAITLGQPIVTSIIKEKLTEKYPMTFLRHIHIDKAHTVENLELPLASSLHITFYDTGKPPVVKNIVAPRLYSLNIYYSKTLPHISEIMVGNDEPSIGTNFTLCNTDATSPNFMLVDKGASAWDYKECDYSFTNRFKCISTIGVPDFVIRKMDLSQAIYWTWFKTVDYRLTKVFSIESSHSVPKLKNLVFITTVPKSQLPELIGASLRGLHIRTTAPGLDLNHTISVNCYQPELQTLSVDCDLPRSLVGTPNAHPVLSGVDLCAIMINENLKLLRLHGCQFGDSNRFVRGMMTPLDYKWATPSMMKEPIEHVSLKFVRGADEGGKGLAFCWFGLIPRPIKYLSILQVSRCGEGGWSSIKVMLPGGAKSLVKRMIIDKKDPVDVGVVPREGLQGLVCQLRDTTGFLKKV